MTQHSDLGASGMHRWMRCPGSFRLCQGMPARPPSVYAATGTLAHEIIEKTLKDGRFELDLSDLSEHVARRDIIPDPGFAEGIELMLDYVARAKDDYELIRTELTVDLHHWFEGAGVTPPVPMFATADVVMLAGDAGRLEIVDYKNGAGILVAAQNNPQLMYYAAGVLALVAKQFPEFAMRSVKITVVQPHAGDTPIRSQVVDVVDVYLWIDEVLIPAVQACAAPDPLFVPGDWCRFCTGARSCPALQLAANELAKREFGGHALPEDPRDLAKQLDLAERAVMWADALRTYALEQLQAQVRIPGWGLEPTRPTRRWVREAEVAAELARENLPMEITHKLELRSPAQLEKQVKGLVPRSWWDTHVAPLIETKSSGVKLARTDNDPAKGFTEGDF